MKTLTSCNPTGLSFRSKQMAAVPGSTVEPLALNITLCQVMVSLSQRQGLGRETDGDWLTPLRTFVRDTLGSGMKLSYRQLHMLLGTVWKMVLTQRSKSKHVWCICKSVSDFNKCKSMNSKISKGFSVINVVHRTHLHKLKGCKVCISVLYDKISRY